MVRYLLRLMGLLGFLFFLGFALKNRAAVPVYDLFGNQWVAPLIMVLLVAFVLGVGLGLLASFGYVYRLRKQILNLRREMRARPTIADLPDQPDAVI